MKTQESKTMNDLVDSINANLASLDAASQIGMQERYLEAQKDALAYELTAWWHDVLASRKRDRDRMIAMISLMLYFMLLEELEDLHDGDY